MGFEGNFYWGVLFWVGNFLQGWVWCGKFKQMDLGSEIVYKGKFWLQNFKLDGF